MKDFCLKKWLEANMTKKKGTTASFISMDVKLFPFSSPLLATSFPFKAELSFYALFGSSLSLLLKLCTSVPVGKFSPFQKLMRRKEAKSN